MSDQKFKGFRFQSQLTLLTVIPVMALAVVAVLVSFFAVNSLVKNLILQRNSNMASIAAGSITQDLHSYLFTLQAAADTLGKQPANNSTDQRMLQEWGGLLGQFEGGVTLLDANGVATASTVNSLDRLGRNYAFRPYFQEAHSQLHAVFSTMIQEQPTGQPAVVIAVPVLQNGQFSGCLIGVLFLRQHEWPKELAMLQATQGSLAYLVDSAGNIIYHPDANQIGKNISQEPGLAGLLSKGKLQSNIFSLGQNGVQQVVSFAPLDDIQWSLIIEEPWLAIIAPVYPYLELVTGILALAVAIAVFVLFFGLRRITRPVLELMQEAQSVTGGASFHPVEEHGPREMRQLIRTFNRMVTNLNEQQNTLRQYAVQALRSQEAERQRISRDLHDQTVQDLVGLSQRLELTRTSLVRDPLDARRRLDELLDLTGRALADVRRMSNDLRPFVLEDLGLAAATQHLCDGLLIELPDLQVDCRVVGKERRLGPEQELIVYRVIQEALSNIRQHARSATQVSVRLCFEEQNLSARVDDNGPGFNLVGMVELMHQDHLGLAGMYERAQLMNGRLEIHTTPGKGTWIELNIPC
ncbi:MAG: cache domain-containing protein [Anaerolineaceae bacterium]|nr:cache domain-containing protein [Anaerolineaceae bacterium]